MNEQTLLLVQPQWRAAFTEFVETGEATRDFLAYLDCDRNALRAADFAFREQVQAIRRLVRQLLPA